MAVFAGFQNIGKVPELRKRLIFTLIMLAVYRIGVFVTIPGVDRNVQVTLLDATAQPVAAWSFRNAFPVVHRLTALDASSSAVVVETLELAFDTMDLEVL